MIKKTVLAFLALSAFVTSCSNDDDTITPTPAATTATLTVNLEGLTDLTGSDLVYEGWIIVDDAPVSTGTFTEITTSADFEVDATQLADATKFVLSIEPANDTDPAPAATKVLAGDFSGDSATIWVAPVTTDASDFSDAWGKFFLRTPTDETGTNNGNDENGVWFGIPGMPPAVGLGLPTLSAGWKYEGWVVVDGTPISTGTFTEFDTQDDSNGFSGTESNQGPPVPGEDFFLNAPDGVTFPLDVRGKTVVVSIEPSPDNSPAPFALKPLVATAGTATAPANYDMDLNLDSLLSGTVTR